MRWIALALVALASPALAQLAKQKLSPEAEAEVAAFIKKSEEKQLRAQEETRRRKEQQEAEARAHLPLAQSARICFWKEAAAQAKKTLAQQKRNAKRLGMMNRRAASDAVVYLDRQETETEEAREKLSEAGSKALSCSRKDVKKVVRCMDADIDVAECQTEKMQAVLRSQ